MKPIKVIVLLIFSTILHNTQAQPWVESMLDKNRSFYDVQEEFNSYFDTIENKKGTGYKPFKRWEAQMLPRVFPSGFRSDVDFEIQENRSNLKSNSNWTPLGPVNFDTQNPISWVFNTNWSGRVNVITADPNNSQILYAGTPSGGLWKTSDGGVQWTALTDKLAALGVSAIAIHPTNSNEIYIGTGDKNATDTYSVGILKSTDGGQSWTQHGMMHEVQSGIQIRKLLIHPNSPNIMLCGTNGGLFKSTDTGLTWTKVLTESIRDIDFNIANPSIIYATSTQFFKSIDNGDNFTQITTGTPPNSEIGRLEIALTQDNPEVVYFVGASNLDGGYAGLWKSSDSGESFNLQSSSPNILGYDEAGLGQGGQGWYDLDVAVNPTNENDVYVGGIILFHSTDGGTSWTAPTNYNHHANAHGDIHSLSFINDKLYCTNDGGIFYGSNNGSGNWNYIASEISNHQAYRMAIDPQDPQRILIGAQDNGYNLRQNNQWYFLGGGDGMECIFHPTNTNILYASWQNANLDKSIDGGIDFSSISPDVPAEYAAWTAPFEMDRFDSETLYLGFENIQKSINGGASWNSISNFDMGSLSSIQQSYQDENVLYASSFSTIQKTTDGGASWTEISQTLPESAITFMHIDPQNDQNLYVAFSGYQDFEKLYFTNDAGSTWQNLSYNLPNLPLNCIEIDESTGGIYVGMDVGIYYLDENLSAWQPFFEDLPNVIINELEITSSIGKIRAATFGRGVWESDLWTPEQVTPEADMVFNANNICIGDSIQFSDNSLNAAPGWQWSFLGGTPATSTLPNPKVYFPASGNYQVTLTVNNTLGSDVSEQTVNVTFNTELVNVVVNTDLYPEESTWKIFDLDGGLIANGGPFSNIYTAYNTTVCLSPGCYDFVMIDSYGDGLLENNTFTVTENSTGNSLATGGEFTFEDRHSFCTDGHFLTITETVTDKGGFLITPNPNKGNFHLSKKDRYVVVNTMGKIIYTSSQPEDQINLKKTPSGIYFVRSINGEHTIKMIID